MSCELCESAVYARGLCQKHYRRFLRQPSGRTKSIRGTYQERFAHKLIKSGADDCWEWPGARTGKGYGVIQEGAKGSRLLLAHRVSYEVHKGPIPEGLLILHSCDNRACVNPAHLRAGTQSENIIEAIGKFRKFVPKQSGAENSRSKLTLEQAKFIKAHPELPHTELAKLFGLSPNCIRGVRIGRTWKDA